MGRVSRGDIVLVAGGVYASKPRPAIVIQDDLFSDTQSVTVCPITSSQAKAALLRFSLPADSNTGLGKDNHAMVDKITTVRRANTGECIGRLSDVQMLELERRLVVFLGIAR